MTNILSDESGISNPTDAPPCILVVDDEPAVRHFLRTILTRLDYQVETAASGGEALKMVEERSYDVVLTDLIMPRVDGLKVIQGVKEKSPDTEVVVITGYPSSESIVAATRAGAVDYLPKSPDPEHLAVLLEKAMEIRSLKRKAKERDMYLRMAQMDGLTELFNHRTFHEFLDREFSRAKRMDQPLTVLFADVDDFKEYNSESGHLFGDQVLKRVAGALRTCCRQYDILARYGGDEFAILAPETPKTGGRSLGERITSAMDELQMPNDRSGQGITLSLGVATYPEDAKAPGALLECADSALFDAKRGGKGKVCLA